MPVNDPTSPRGSSPRQSAFAPVRIWQTKGIPGDNVPSRGALLTVGAAISAFVCITVAFVWLLREPVAAAPVEVSQEVSLGSFHFGTSRTSDQRTLAFEAVAVVGEERAEESEELLRSHAARVSQAVEEAGRAVTDRELTEPDLFTFRGRIRGGVNRVLRRPAVDDVILNDFRTF